jgi:flavin reductase (DIM6/NTAB) family NADH-FMN oxidoreductase RutF
MKSTKWTSYAGRVVGLISTARPSMSRSYCSLNEQYRQAMSAVAASAMIITTNHIDKTTNQPEPRGLTVSSLSSLSIKPSPLVSFNIQVPSRTSQVLRDSLKFAVNILPPTSVSAEVCRAFAGRLGQTVNPFEVEKSLLKYGHDGMPIVSCAVAVLYCTAVEVFQVQDHEIWVAQVTEVEVQDTANDGTLLYQNRAFHLLGSEITSDTNRED